MKKTGYYIFGLLLLLAACRKDTTHPFDESPDQRLNEVLAKYQSALSGASYGWKGLVYPAGLPGTVFSFYFKFNDSNRVQMFADLSPTSAVTMQESSYRLKALQQPALLFDTYSYLHELADPDGSVNGGTNGSGLKSDFEFSLDRQAGDTIYLTGRFNNSKALLIKCSKEERDLYYAQKHYNPDILQYAKILNYFKLLTIGDHAYDVRIDTDQRMVTLTWVDNKGTVETVTIPFYYSATGLTFTTPFTDGDLTLTGLDNITWDAAGNQLHFTVAGNSNTGTIFGTGYPRVLDKNAPQRWWQYSVNNGSYWISPSGFHMNGVDDAFNMASIPNYYYTLYWAQPSGNNYDGMAAVYVKDGALAIYGPALQPKFTTDGRAIFTALGTVGTSPSDSTTAIMTRVQQQFVDNAGYYFVQTSSTSFDMVSVKDTRTWISWYYY